MSERRSTVQKNQSVATAGNNPFGFARIADAFGGRTKIGADFDKFANAPGSARGAAKAPIGIRLLEFGQPRNSSRHRCKVGKPFCQLHEHIDRRVVLHRQIPPADSGALCRTPANSPNASSQGSTIRTFFNRSTASLSCFGKLSIAAVTAGEGLS